MKTSVGSNKELDTREAGRLAAREALDKAAAHGPCDMAIVLTSNHHDARILKEPILKELGPQTLLVGGTVFGVISNDLIAYNSPCVLVCAIWLEGTKCHIVTESDLKLEDEYKIGAKLGDKLKALGVTKESSALLMYDAVYHRGQEDIKMLPCTPLLNGIKKSLGFLPNINGFGFFSNFELSGTQQFTGTEVESNSITILLFEDSVHIDSVTMCGTEPASLYYTVTKSDDLTILEINGEPAIPFIQKVIGPSLPIEKYSFFLTLGINRGDKWADFDDNNYVSRLCFTVDKERNGLVLSEPDMVSGTEFQLMTRVVMLDYIPQRIDGLFKSVDSDRELALAIYIDCAGRSGAFSGLNEEDATYVQRNLGGRLPLIGMYSAMELAPISGEPRPLSWTGVFCLLSVDKHN